MKKDSVTKGSTITETLQMSDTMCAQFAVSRDYEQHCYVTVYQFQDLAIFSIPQIENL